MKELKYRVTPIYVHEDEPKQESIECQPVGISEPIEANPFVNYKPWFPFSRIGLFYFCCIVGTYLVATILSFVFLFILGSATAANDFYTNNMFVVMAVCYAVTIPICMLIIKTVPKYQNVQKRKWKVSKFLFFVMIALGAMMLGNMLSLIGVSIISLITGHQMINPVNNILNDDNIVGSLINVVVLAPFVEEFLFRKILLDRVSVYGDKIAIVLSGVIFGVYHGNLFQVVYATMVGMVLAYVYLKTRRIEYCIGIHFIINALGGALPLLLTYMAPAETLTGAETIFENPRLIIMSLLVLFELMCMVASIVMIMVLYKRVSLQPAAIEIPKGKKFKTVYLNPGMIMFFVISVGIFILNAMA